MCSAAEDHSAWRRVCSVSPPAPSVRWAREVARPGQSFALLGHQGFDSLQDLSSAGVAMAGRAVATAGPGGAGAARVALQEVLWFDSVPK